MRVKRVTRISAPEPVPVYDLSVPGLENFVLANGAVVHNSKDCADAVCGAYHNLLSRSSTWVGGFSQMEDPRLSGRVDMGGRFDDDRPE